MKLQLHAACKLFPQIPDDELQQLADDIRANGLRNPVVLLDGKVLDGRNRLAACEIAGVDPRFEKWDGQGSPVEWVISQNLMRRHLTASQRAVVAHDLLPMLAKEAKERQRRSKGRGKKVAKNCATFLSNGKASEAAARITRTNARYVEMLKAIHGAAPELVDRVRSGQLSVSDAERLTKLTTTQRNRLLSQIDNEDGLKAESIRLLSGDKRSRRETRRTDAASRYKVTTLRHGDCQGKLKEIPSKSVDLVLCDPPYPETRREYGKLTEQQWHDLMQTVVRECRRILKPKGSAVFILQPNFRRLGSMRLWLWEFLLWAAKEWNLIQDAYWWAIDTLPTAGTSRTVGMMRQSVKMCIWLGAPDCYRNQDAVLWSPSEGHAARKWSDRALRYRPSGHTVRDGRTAMTSVARDGTTPFNLLPIPNVGIVGADDHPATTPYELAAWWCRYLLPPKGILCDPFCGSGTTLKAGLDYGASQVVGIDKERKYLTTAKKRVGQM